MRYDRRKSTLQQRERRPRRKRMRESKRITFLTKVCIAIMAILEKIVKEDRKAGIRASIIKMKGQKCFSKIYEVDFKEKKVIKKISKNRISETTQVEMEVA